MEIEKITKITLTNDESKILHQAQKILDEICYACDICVRSYDKVFTFLEDEEEASNHSILVEGY